MPVLCIVHRFHRRSLVWLASFPGLPTVQFLIACSMQKQRGKAWYHLSREWRQCLHRQRGGGVTDRKDAFRTCVLRFEPRAVCFLHRKRFSAWARNYKIRPLACSFDGDPPPPPPLWHHSRDKWYQAFPLRFCILQAIKNWTVGRPGNEVMVW